jgi:hypothetical protein
MIIREVSMRRSVIIAALTVGILALGPASAATASPAAASEGKPVITGLSLGSGTTAGGSTLVITGKRLDGVTRVRFGHASVSATAYPGVGRVAAQTPKHAAGLVHVQVVSPHGTSAVTATSAFRYVQPAKGGALTWTSPRWPTEAVAEGGGIGQVACPTANACVAADNGGNVSYLRSGVWSPAHRVDDTELADLSCPTTTFCIAIDHANRALRYDGATWTTPATLDADLATDAHVNVSCSSATFCLAISTENTYQFFDGSSWTAATQIPEPGTAGSMHSFDCSPDDYCLGWAYPGDSDEDPGELESFDGTTWTFLGDFDGDQADLDYPDYVEQVSCPVSHTCAVFDTADKVTLFDDGSLTHQYDVGGDALADPVSLSCTSPTFCISMKMGDSGRVYVQWFDGTTWRYLRKPATYFGNSGEASCATPTFCVVSTGVVDVTEYRGGASLTDAQVVFPTYDLADVSCPVVKFCMTTGGYGVAATFDGRTYGKAHVASNDATGASHVSCATRSMCALTSGTHAVVWNGTRWHGDQKIDAHQLTAVSCGSTRFCVATDTVGRVSTYNGKKWTQPHRVAGHRRLISVSCADDQLCAAVDETGGVVAYQHGRWVAHPGEFDTGWYSLLDGATASCGSIVRCVVEDDDGSIATYNGHRWSRPTGIVHMHVYYDGLRTLSCTSASFCAAGEYAASTHTYNGSKWSTGHAIDIEYGPAELSCASRKWCLAVTLRGRYIVGKS